MLSRNALASPVHGKAAATTMAEKRVQMVGVEASNHGGEYAAGSDD